MWLKKVWFKPKNPMKVIIAGSRDLVIDSETFFKEIDLNYPDIVEVVSGVSGNIDFLGITYANIKGLKCTKFRANWNLHGRAAGPIRNAEMATYADGAIVFMKKTGSKGSQNMIETMKKLKKPVVVINI
jgi:hypothetical protein